MEEEKELEAKKWFGDEFVESFENLKLRFKNNNTLLRIHGTTEESAKQILKEGLIFDGSTIRCTSYDYSNYAILKQWPHNDFKHLVLLGIPLECTEYCLGEVKPLYTQVGEDSIYGSRKLLASEFIAGYIDVSSKQIIPNKQYLDKHSFEEQYIIDSELAGVDINKDEFEEFYGVSWDDIDDFEPSEFNIDELKKVDEEITPEERKKGLNILNGLMKTEEKDFDGVDFEDGWE